MELTKLVGLGLNQIFLTVMDNIIDQLCKTDGLITPVDTRPQSFFNSIYQTFQRAEKVAGGPKNRFYSTGGYNIKLRFAGSALIPFITPALEHLSSQPTSSPSLTVCLWDSASTRTIMPPPPWSMDDYITRGEIRSYNEGSIRTSYYPGSGVLNILNINLNVAVYWIRNAYQIPYYESGSPLLPILHWWMCNHGRQLVHAGAVGTAKGGVLLIGKAGSGKSTMALVCLNSELLYVSDDYCLITTNPEPYAYSMYNSGKVNAEDIKRFPFLAQSLSNPSRLETEKALYFLYKHFPDKISTGFPIRAILLPRVTGFPLTRLKRISSSACLLALAPSTIFQLPGAGHKTLESLSEILKQVPCYILEMGNDISKIPYAILSLLSEH